MLEKSNRQNVGVVNNDVMRIKMELFSRKLAFDKNLSEIIKDDFFILKYLKDLCLELNKTS
jgi:hypothetical protein